MRRFSLALVALVVSAFPALAYDPIGTTPPDARGIVRQQTPHADQMIRRFDRDGDGKLDAMELRAMHQARRDDPRRGPQPNRGAPIFERKPPKPEQFDRDGDGQLSHDEAAAFHQAISKSLTSNAWGHAAGAAMRRHREMDLNSDGLISQDEMRAHRQRLAR